MKTINIIKQDGNRSIGIFMDNSGEYLATTYTASKYFKTEKSATKWLAKKGYK